MQKISAEQAKQLYKEAGILRDSMRRIWRRILQAPPPKPRNVSRFDSAIRKYITRHGLIADGLRTPQTFPLKSGREFKMF